MIAGPAELQISEVLQQLLAALPAPEDLAVTWRSRAANNAAAASPARASAAADVNPSSATDDISRQNREVSEACLALVMESAAKQPPHTTLGIMQRWAAGGHHDLRLLGLEIIAQLDHCL